MVTGTTVTLDDVRDAVARVRDPEIPSCTIDELGMIGDIRVGGDTIEIDLLPTFVGCPAKDVIGEDVRRAASAAAGAREIRVRFVYDPPWTTDRISEEGRAKLREFGIAPHWERASGATPVPLLSRAGVACPFCGSDETVMDSAWGPTPCRATHYCRTCRNPFEGFKTKTP